LSTFCELDRDVVIDDGSTDGTEQIVRDCAGPVEIFFHHYVENQGAAHARNVGVSRARGEWIAFLDADAFWHCDKLKIATAIPVKYQRQERRGVGAGRNLGVSL
jgi:glycosyltransferase involved in cell wall biosynthesis